MNIKSTIQRLFATALFTILPIISASAFEVDGMSYQAINSSEVRLTKGLNQAEVIIPSTITYNGVTYTVTEIYRQAFYSFKNTRRIVIPGSVRTIGDQSFYDNYYLEEIELNEGLERIETDAFGYAFPLKEIRLPSTLYYIGHQAFITNRTNQASIFCYASTPPTIADNTALKGRTNTTLHVYAQDLDLYKEAAYWKEFTSFEGLTTSGRCYNPIITYDNYRLTMSCETEEASIYYTTDGSIPDETSIRYTSPFTYNTNLPIRAIAIADGKENSGIRGFNLNQDLFQVEASFDATLSNDFMMTITCESPVIPGLPDVTIWYRNANSDSEWEEYVAPIKMQRPGYIEIFAQRDGWVATATSSFDFYTNYYLQAPTISWNAEERKISITHDDPDVDIYYTLDGTDPSVESSLYSEPITITKNTEIKAIAAKRGKFDSDIVSYKVSDIFTRFYVNGIYYQLTGNMIDEVQVDDGKNASGKVVIPEEVTFSGQIFRVIGIATQAFKDNKQIKSVSLPNSITYINNSTFENCSLIEIDIPGSVETIGNRAFFSSSLEKITFHEGLLHIGDEAFAQGAKNSYSSRYDDKPLNCEIIFPNSLLTIGECAFKANTLVPKIIIPEGVISIGANAFEACYSITHIELPNSLQSLKGIFHGCRGLRTVKLPSNLGQIGDDILGGFFDDCRSLVSVDIPEGVTIISEGMFRGCESLTSVSLPLSVTEIQREAFQDCKLLQSIVLPENVAILGKDAFARCSSLKSVYSQSPTPPNMNNGMAFPEMSNQVTVYVKGKSLQSYKEANYWAEFSSIKPIELLPCAQPMITLTEDYTLVMQSQTERATIYYTTDGSDPTNLSNKYTSPIPHLKNDFIYRAIAICDGYSNSEIAEYSKPLQVPKPSVNITNCIVTIAYDKPNIPNMPETKISYEYRRRYNQTYGWNDVLISEGTYEFPFHLINFENTNTRYTTRYLYVKAERDGWEDSETVKVTLNDKLFDLNMPVIAYEENTHTVTITSNIPGAEIYYTLDGSEPDRNSTRYEAPFSVDRSYKVKAFAVLDGYADSQASSYEVSLNSIFEENDICYQLSEKSTGNCVEVVKGDYPFVYEGDIIVPATITHNGTEYTVIGIGKGAFYDYKKTIESVTLPNTIQYIEEHGFWNGIIKSIKIPSSVKEIKEKAFQNCTELQSVEISPGLSTIGSYAFEGCTSLTTLNLPTSIKNIGGGAFRECTSLTSIKFPDGIEYLGNQTFENCSSLTSLSFPSTLKTIGYEFKNCNGLSSITFPVNLQIIQSGAFDGCYNIKSVYCENTTPPIFEETSNYNKSPFSDFRNNATLYVKSSALDAYKAAEYWASFSSILPYDDSTIKSPLFSFSNDTYTLTITSETEGAKIYYTDDGSTPTEESTLYTEPIPFVRNDTIYAIAVAEGMGSSSVATFMKRDLKVATPVATLSDDLMMTITCEENAPETFPETKIYYQKNKKSNNYEGFSNWILYEGPVQLTEPGHVRTTALRDGWINSEWGQYNFYNGYIFDKPIFEENQEKKVVVLKHSDPDAKIYYTLDGTKPTKASTLYEDTIHLEHNSVVTAVAAKDRYFNTDTIRREYKWFTAKQPEVTISKNIATITCEEPAEAEIYYTLDNSNPSRESKKYDGPIVLASNCNIKAFAVAENWNDAPVTSYRYRVVEHTCKKPAFSRYAKDEEGNLHMTEDSLFITTETEDAIIYYTLNGDKPTERSLRYEGFIKLTGNCTVKAIAVRADLLDSEEAELAIDWFKVETPQIAFEGKLCTITSDSEGATIYYTTDESEPTTHSTFYKGRFALPNQQVIVKAMAVKEDWHNSEIRTRTYNPGGNTCEAPVIARVVGTDSIQMSTRTENTTIYYTLNGLNPTVSDSVYTKPFCLPHNGTLKAMATNPIYYDSEVSTLNVNWFKVNQPVITVEDKIITISCAKEGATIHYTLDGTEPTEENTVYRDRLIMTGSCVIKAVATFDNFNNSNIVKLDYRASEHACATPEFTKTDSLVTINCATEGNTTIYYTTDGSTPTAKSEVYTEPIRPVENGTIKAIAMNAKLFDSEEADYEVGWFKTENPEIISDGIFIEMACATPNSKIYYTLDGTAPNEESPVYSGRLTMTGTCTIKALAVRENFKNSAITTIVFDKAQNTVAAPLFQRSDSLIAITSASPDGTTIYYTVDGTDPTTSSEVYENPVKASENFTLKAIAVNPKMFDSPVGSYEVNWFKADMPVLSFDGFYVSMSCATAGSRIFYTLDGTSPNEESLRYSEAVRLGNSCTVKAVAMRDNFNNSPVVTASFDRGDNTVGRPQFERSGDTLSISSQSALDGTVVYYTTDGSDPTTASTQYAAPVVLQGNCTVKAIGVNPKLFTSETSTYDVNWFRVEAPVITFDGIEAEISTQTPGSKIFYTLDGKTPSEESLRYVGPVTMTDSCTVRAIAVRENYNNSAVSSVYFDKDRNTASRPLFQRSDSLIAITSASPDGTTIYYTVDGTDPTTSSEVYEKPVKASENFTLKAIAVNPKMFDSPVGSYEVNWFKADMPVLSFDGFYVSMSCATAGSRIFYTLDGTSPNEESLRYSEAVRLGNSCTVKAVAMRDNFNNSPIVTASFDRGDNTVGRPQFERSGDTLSISSQSALDGTVVYYTTDGSDPTTASTQYAAPVVLQGNCTVKAIGVNPKLFTSETSTYDVNWFRVEAPVITFDGIEAEISTQTPGSKIFYTLDGKTPSEESLRYVGPVTMTDSCTVRAIAVRENYNNSAVSSVYFDKDRNTASRPLFQRSDSLIAITSASPDGTIIYYTVDGTDPTTSSEVYEKPVKASENFTLKAIAVNPKMFDSPVGSYEVNWFKADMPVLSFDGFYVSMSCATAGSRIFYTLDGTSPNEESLRYSEAVRLGNSCTVKAVAMRDNFNNSPVVTASFDRGDNTVGRPQFERSGDTLSISSQSALDGTVVYYTTDGSDPTTASTQYAAPVVLQGNCTVKAIGVNPKLFTSETSTYDVNWFRVEAPVITFDGIEATISCETPNSRIYYTLDGTVPTAESYRYNSTLTMSNTCTIKAIAVKENWNNSQVVSTLFEKEMNTVGNPLYVRDGNVLAIQSASTIEGTSIYYTTDGSEPTTGSSVYTAPITLKENMTLKAFASNPKLFRSETTSYNVDWFKVETPVIVLDGNKVTISCNTPDVTIYYAYSEEPTTSSAIYKEALTLIDNRTVYAYATKTNFHDSEMAKVMPSLFVCDEVTFNYNGHYLQMSTSEGSTIHYTLDGTKPSADAPVYTNAVEIEKVCTVRAIAMRRDFRDSPETAYTITYLYNGEEANLEEGGHLEEVFNWIGGADNVVTLPVKGKMNDKDLNFIRGMRSLRHLDLSEATYEGAYLPDEAFAGMKLLSFISPKQLVGAGEHLFKGCDDLAAIVWNANISVPETTIEDVKQNPNFLLYVNSRIYVPASYRGNLVSGGQASSITLTDMPSGGNFCCPQRFYTQQISYTHYYGQTTESGVARGWETLSLPFDVKTITHEKKGALAPFAKEADITKYKPFWLYELKETGFTRTGDIEAYKPYVISMPNNPSYADDYILAGKVTFSATDTYIEADTACVMLKGSLKFAPSMQRQPKSAQVMAINLEDYTDDEGIFYLSGSTFLPDMREVKPFEAYALVNSSMSAPMMISSYIWNDVNDIIDIEIKALQDTKKGIFDLSGRRLSKDSSVLNNKVLHRQKIYIIDGKKKLVK